MIKFYNACWLKCELDLPYIPAGCDSIGEVGTKDPALKARPAKHFKKFGKLIEKTMAYS